MAFTIPGLDLLRAAWKAIAALFRTALKTPVRAAAAVVVVALALYAAVDLVDRSIDVFKHWKESNVEVSEPDIHAEPEYEDLHYQAPAKGK